MMTIPHLGLAVTCLFHLVVGSTAAVSCLNTEECEQTLRKGSECVLGYCTNPFYKDGCLKSYLPEWEKTRICSSDDPPDAIMKGYCIPSPFDYNEIRIFSLNWESAFFMTWVMQIVLSEMLGVPTSVETGLPGLVADFYNVNSTLDYGGGVDEAVSALQKSAEVGDCRQIKNIDDSNYQPCSQVLPEVWGMKRYQDAVNVTEPPVSHGALGSEGNWFIPKFTAERDPSLVSHFGLRGESNRRKLADRFLRPTKWKDYCEQVSQSFCQESDATAIRAPINEDEEESYFVEGLYTGHFRSTSSNDCDLYPQNCTGHIADYPCTWYSNLIQQTFHLDIALESSGEEPSGGYAYEHLTQIWAAANATKSDVITLWWKPEALSQSYIGTDAEFIQVALPTPTQSCINARAMASDVCKLSLEERRGDPAGACDKEVADIQKLLGIKLFHMTHSPAISEALWSPGYDAIKNIKLTEYQLGEIFGYWLKRGTDKMNFDPRDAVCRWVVENIDLVKSSFLPPTFPRVIDDEDFGSNSFFTASLAVACLATVIVAFCMVFTYIRRKKKAVILAQIQFLEVTLCGLLLVACSAFFFSLTPEDSICVAGGWLSNLGYTVVMVPLLVRIDAINKLVSAGKHMQRLKLTKEQLFLPIAGATAIMAVILITWTIWDPPVRRIDYVVTSATSYDGSTIVEATSFCGSNSNLWMLVALLWQTFLILPALMLALMARRLLEDINDTTSLGTLIFIHVFFLAFRFVLFIILRDSVGERTYVLCLSMARSTECVVAVCIYFFPKAMDTTKNQDQDEPDPDLFLNTTILFADICGFTAWSSVREPVEVFKFLETIYHCFDDIAEKRQVLKVETSGDCYIAATGIPKPRPDHAVMMARFATDCMIRFNKLTDDLDLVFGPDTSNLGLRIGIHSGPVTGGFLRGKGARFQLFGDTMNMAAEIESTGERGRIHLSEATATLLTRANKSKWVCKRADVVRTKAKGTIQTYWLECLGYRCTAGEAGSSMGDTTEQSFDRELWQIDHAGSGADKTIRLIEWNCGVLQRLLKQIVARRTISSTRNATRKSASSDDKSFPNVRMPLEEVAEIIALPDFDQKVASQLQKQLDAIEIPAIVLEQLKDYVTTIAYMYRNNPFHNFAHASHVVQSVIKHMNRIVAPSDVIMDSGGENDMKSNKARNAAALHDHTYGITSDPLTQFACVFSALIHDVDHPGVPNARLVEEHTDVAAAYQNRSIAEQNSLDLSWKLLMEDRFEDLRNTIWHDASEMKRFRQLVVNSVMATDIADKLLKELRNARWDKAFTDKTFTESFEDAKHRKATIVIEHLIQAADISHTMQHWHIYREWNEKLFRELYAAYRSGRASTHPAEFWYQGELGFFDFYIIPLSKKLSECGVFGLSSDENLNYALRNREEWEARGKDLVIEMTENIEKEELADKALNDDHPVEPV